MRYPFHASALDYACAHASGAYIRGGIALVHSLCALPACASLCAGVDAKFKEVDLSPSQDEFYRELMFLNFADACGLVSSRVKQHMDEKGLRMDLSTMDAMESAIAKLPDLQRQNFTMLKHYQIISELNKIVSARRRYHDVRACVCTCVPRIHVRTHALCHM